MDDGGRSRAWIPSLDGLRCLAILPVIWHHSTSAPAPGLLGKGPLGVHLFFAISGFLITTLLLQERADTRRISLRRFFGRRSLRIFPLYYAVLALFVLRALWFLPDSPMRAHFLGNVPYFATYTTNWFVDFGVPHPVIFGFSWSLATEEQFYLVWPLVIASSRSLAAPVAFVIGLLALDRAGLGHLAFLGVHGTLFRIVTSISTPICIGSLLACGLASPRAARAIRRVLGPRFMAPLVLFALVACVFIDAPLLLIHVAMTALVGAVTIRRDHGLAFFLDARPVRYVGSISYAMYLLHVSAITLVKMLGVSTPPLAVFVLATLVTVLLASITRRHIELPILRWRDRRLPAPGSARVRAPLVPVIGLTSDGR